MNSPTMNPEIGRTIVYRGNGGEIVLSSSHIEDTLPNMVKIIEGMLKNIIKKGEIPYIG